MGGTQSIEANLWSSSYQFQSKNSKVGIIKLTDKQTQDAYICRKISTLDKKQIQQMQRLIDLKLSIQSPYVTKLQRAERQKHQQYCAYGKNFYLLFKQPYQTLKQQTLNRKFKNSLYSQAQISVMLEVGVKALSFLKNIDNSHQNISSTSFFVNQNRSLILGDPWMFPKQNSPQITRNAFIYPSPQMIKYQNNQINFYNCHLSDLFTLGLVLLEVMYMVNMDCMYERYFQRVDFEAIWTKLNPIKNQQLKRKLFILLDPQPKNRQMIFKFYLKPISSFEVLNRISKQNFKRNIDRYNLATSQVTQWKNELPFETRLNSSQGKKTFSVSTAQNFFNQQKNHNYYQRQYGQYNKPKPLQRSQVYNVFENSNQLNLLDTKPQYNSTNLSYQTGNNKETLNSSRLYKQNTYQIPTYSNNISSYQPSSFTSITSQTNYQIPLLSQRSTTVNLNQTSYEIPKSNIYFNKATPIIQNQDYNTFKPLPQISMIKPLYSYSSTLNNYNSMNYNPSSSPINNFQTYPNISQNSLFPSINFDIKQNSDNVNNVKFQQNINTIVQKKSQTPINIQRPKSQIKLVDNLNKKQQLQLKQLNLAKQQENQEQEKQQQAQKQIQQHKLQSQTPSKQKGKRSSSQYGKLQHLSTINQRSQMTESFISDNQDKKSDILIQQDNQNLQNQKQYHSEKQQNYNSLPQENKVWSIVYPSGTKYIGEIKNDKRNGLGTFFYIDGSKYHGNWFDNKMNGFGTLYYPNGKIAYQGEWKVDNFHGKGKVFNDQIANFEGNYHYEDCTDIDNFWMEYNGQLFEDRKEGKGLLKLVNGQYFEGVFKDDQLHGLCKFHKSDGQIIQGVWKNNKFLKLITEQQKKDEISLNQEFK